MRCERVLERLDAFRTRELREREQQAIAEHMADCRPCEDALTEVSGLAARLQGLRVQAPEGLAGTVLAETGDRYGSVETELGRAWIGFNERGVTLVHLGPEEAAEFERTYEQRRGRRPRPAEVPERYARTVAGAAAGEPQAGPPVDLSALPAFEREVLQALRRIPRGEVRPYAWLAREAGRPGAVRAVGNALAKNPVPLVLPCHRVVPASGGVGEYALGSALKRAVLTREGVPLDELDRLSGRRVRYLGCKTTGVYCFPTCRSIRRARVENRIPLASPREAAEAGFRPCQRCRPVASAA